MRAINQYLETGVLSVALLFGSAAQAMQIPQFDKMNSSDRDDFRALLINTAFEDLMARGQKDQAEKLASLFEDKSDKGGYAQFDDNLALARELNKQHADDANNKNPPYEVEHAMALTLKNAGIQVSVATLLAAGKNFKPKYPPQKDGGAQKH